MTLRDAFAVALIGATFARPFHISDQGMEDNARDAYHQADVMLRIRDESATENDAARVRRLREKERRDAN